MIILERSGKCKNHHRLICCVVLVPGSCISVCVSVCPVPAPGNNVNNKSCGSRGFVSRPPPLLHHTPPLLLPQSLPELAVATPLQRGFCYKETLGKSTAICFQSIRNSCTDFPTNRTFELSSQRNPLPAFQLENRISGKQSNTVG